MSHIAEGSRGLWLILDLNTDRLLFVGAIGAALLSVGYLASL